METNPVNKLPPFLPNIQKICRFFQAGLLIVTVSFLLIYQPNMIGIDTNELISMAESLPIEIKTQLIDKLLNRLHPSQKEIEELWAKEAERRVAEIRGGKVEPVPGEAVLRTVFLWKDRAKFR